MKKHSITFCVAMVAVSLAGVMLSDVSFADRKDMVDARIKEIAKLKETRRGLSDLPELKRGKRKVDMCMDFYTTVWIEPETDPHIAMDDKFVLVGPNPYSGIWQVTPIGSHNWEHGHYQAVPSTTPNVFEIWSVNVKPHGSEAERVHYYRMEIVAWGGDKCPDYVIFEHTSHVPGLLSLDPGHAGVER